MMATVNPEQGSFIDGLGDEVITALALSTTTIISVYVLFRVLSRNNFEGDVHPDQADTVESTRRDLGVGQQADTATINDPTVTNCPVCLAPLTYPIQTNCGHQFCANCLLSYWQHDQWPRPARCPVCRRQVTLLLPSESLQLATGEGERLWTQVTDYNQRMSGQWRPVMHYIYDIPVLLRHMWRGLFTVRGLVVLHKLHLLFILLLIALYLLSPFDLLPEAVLGIVGLLDDIIIILGALVYISFVYRAFVANGMH